ncbi:MAG: DNA polymerase, partial [Bacteroidetes bacterium]|nr:DNA polymerase [Bacteroidota bacterium]
MGSAAKIESLMVREYIRLKHSLPKPQDGAQTTGGYTNIFQLGVLGPIIHADIESLYPSIMVTKEIAPASDINRVFLSLLRDLTTKRLETKKQARAEKDHVKRSRLDAMQGSLKILINSFYGYLGYNRALFNDYKAADNVTQTGQQLLKQMIDHVEMNGGKVIEVDTDGVFFVPPEHVEGEEKELAFARELSGVMPEGITAALDGRYKKMMSYKKKNYALLTYDDRIRIKGSSLISRSMERFARTYIRQCIDYLLNKNIEGIHNLYGEYRRAIQGHTLSVADFARVETLRDSLDQYEQQVGSGKRNRSAPYQVALSSGKPYRPGDKVAYYITGNDPNARGFDNCKSADDWDPNFPDANVPYYLRRLDEFSEKFAEFFQPQDFRAIFSAEDLFSFDPRGIVPLV